MKTLLMYPPISDPTSGYHSLCYIESYARQFGYDEIDILDTNIEAFLYSASAEQLQKTLSYIAERRKILENSKSLTAIEQAELNYLLKADGMNFKEKLPAAIQQMREEASFYNYSKYRSSVDLLNNWINTLSIFGYPGQFYGFFLKTHGFYNLFSAKDLCDHRIVNRIAAPFESYFVNVLLPKIEQGGYCVVGINITYVAQLPFALNMARRIRAKFPDIHILFGGTEVSDVWKYLLDKSKFFEIFDAVDACVIGEGETAFVDLLDQIRDGRPYSKRPNVIVHPKHGDQAVLTKADINYENIAILPTPDYSKLPFEKYLSPHTFVYYSPSRGCYWNRCTFCDYGLNMDSPTSPWRQYEVEKIINDLREMSKVHKYIYFSVDVLAPAMLLKMAERIIEEGIDIRWSAEIRLEKYWSPERCELLKKSGCCAISVGFESGNQRILDLIDKGTSVPRLKETIQNFANANIGVQVMGFTGFPTETLDEALDSVRFLRENREHWTFGGLGSFMLTQGAIAARQPEQFQIRNVRPFDGEDVAWRFFYEDLTGGHGGDEQEERLNQERSTLIQRHYDRPWVGGVDCAHSIFYHDKFEDSLLNIIMAVPELKPLLGVELFLQGHVATENGVFPRQKLFNDDELQQLLKKFEQHAKGLTGTEVEELLADRQLFAEETTSPKRYFNRKDGTVFPFPEEMLKFLGHFEGGNRFELYPIEAEQKALYEKLLEHAIIHRFVCSDDQSNPTNPLILQEQRV